MVSSLDKSVGQTIRALSVRSMLNNSIVLLYSDNGAPTLGIHSNAGSNHPFRGVSILNIALIRQPNKLKCLGLYYC